MFVCQCFRNFKLAHGFHHGICHGNYVDLPLSQDFQDETRDRLGGSDGEEQADAIEARPNLLMTFAVWFNRDFVNHILTILWLIPPFSLTTWNQISNHKTEGIHEYLPAEEAIGDYDSNPFLLNAKVGCKGLILTCEIRPSLSQWLTL